ncbi:fatty acid desaturase [Labrys miyagiensis]|uniref:fatty acid desaturase n=1 Tax=Labrys miyagiensis TaxID=346912 RepID=UPI0024E0AE20|nr:fatty acid desaturase [Labrys miyagiensis]
MQKLSPYREVKPLRSVFELAITGLAFVMLWTLTWAALYVGYWLSLLLTVPASCFLMRLFMIQHDCGHGAFFRSRSTNDWVGRVLGVVTLTPYAFWRRTHAIHHAGVGNLEQRGIGDIDTRTVNEYLAMPAAGRLRYRSYRSPVVMFCLIPAFLFLIRHRLPCGLMGVGSQPWISTMGTNFAIAVLIALMAELVGFEAFLLVQIPIVLIAASIAMWFFYVQHQFENTRWVHQETWKVHEAALYGSSHYELPPLFAWFTGNIGVHHVHHLNSRIPFYRLRQVVNDHPELAGIGTLTFLQSLKCTSLALWDEEQGRLISFRELRRERNPQTGGA